MERIRAQRTHTYARKHIHTRWTRSSQAVARRNAAPAWREHARKFTVANCSSHEGSESEKGVVLGATLSSSLNQRRRQCAFIRHCERCGRQSGSLAAGATASLALPCHSARLICEGKDWERRAYTLGIRMSVVMAYTGSITQIWLPPPPRLYITSSSHVRSTAA